MIRFIPKSFVDSVWEQAEPLLRKAEEHACGEMTVEDIYNLLKQDKQQLSLVIDNKEVIGAYVTDVCVYPRMLTLRVLWGGGEKGRMDEYLDDLIEHLREGAKQIGADAVEVYGRLGWKKALKQYGFKETNIVLSMVV